MNLVYQERQSVHRMIVQVENHFLDFCLTIFLVVVVQRRVTSRYLLHFVKEVCHKLGEWDVVDELDSLSLVHVFLFDVVRSAIHKELFDVFCVLGGGDDSCSIDRLEPLVNLVDIINVCRIIHK